ncbi:MAG: hypothetical protein WDW38_001491 [Sanguina aurantia]
MSETTRAADDLRVVRKLLWEVLSAKLHPAERQEVKRAIGAALIEENTGLFAEADAYSEILGDVQLGTEALLVRRQRCSTPQRTLEKLNVAAIDAVSAALRLALEEEREALTEDVEYLQALLQDEADRQHTVQHTLPPSIQDLTDYTARLSEAVGQEEARVEHEWRVAHMFEAADGEFSAAGRLRSMVGVSRNGVPSSKPLWAGAFDEEVTTPGLSIHGASPEVHSSIPEEPSPDGPKLSHTLQDNPSIPPPPTSQAPLHPHPPHGAPLSRRPGIDSPLKGNGSSRTLMHTLSPNGHSQHGPVHLAHPSHQPPPPQNLPPQHPPPQHPSPQQPPHQRTSHSSITNSQPPLAELRQTSRPSSREQVVGHSTADAMLPVIGPGPLGVLRHLSASRNRLSGFRPHSPASPSKPAFEQPLLQQSKGLGSSLGGIGSLPFLSPQQGPPPAPLNTLTSILAEREYMSQFDTSSPKPSTPTGPGSAMAVAALLDSYGSNLDDHPLLSEDDFNDYPDTDSPNTHAQSAAQLQDKIEDQTTTISHLRSKNHQLVGMVLSLTKELEAERRQNKLHAETSCNLAASRGEQDHCVPSDDGEHTDESGHTTRAAVDVEVLLA